MKVTTVLGWATAGAVLMFVSTGVADDSNTLLGHDLVYKETFDGGSAEKWEPTDDKAWRIVEQDGDYVYNQFEKRSQYNPPVRSPYNRAILKDVVVSDFVLDVQLQSTHPDYGHRDLCLFFGYQDPSHFYYVHFGKKMDDHANNIFVVNDADRLRISEKTTEGTNWDDEWHHARVVRNVEEGTIEVYFDDMEEPVMTAVDKNFTWGRVGIGSFDDTGNFDDIAVYGTEVDPQDVE